MRREVEAVKGLAARSGAAGAAWFCELEGGGGLQREIESSAGIGHGGGGGDWVEALEPERGQGKGRGSCGAPLRCRVWFL